MEPGKEIAQGCDNNARTHSFLGCPRVASEAEADLSCDGSRRHVVGSAKRGEKVVEGHFVRQIDQRDSGAPTAFVAMEEIVIADGKIKQVTRSDARRILVVIFRSGCWNRD